MKFWRIALSSNNSGQYSHRCQESSSASPQRAQEISVTSFQCPICLLKRLCSVTICDSIFSSRRYKTTDQNIFFKKKIDLQNSIIWTYYRPVAIAQASSSTYRLQSWIYAKYTYSLHWHAIFLHFGLFARLSHLELFCGKHDLFIGCREGRRVREDWSHFLAAFRWKGKAFSTAILINEQRSDVKDTAKFLLFFRLSPFPLPGV